MQTVSEDQHQLPQIDLDKFDRKLEEDYSSANGYFSIISNCISAIFGSASFALGIIVCTWYPEAYTNTKQAACKGLTLRYLIIVHLALLALQLAYTLLTITLHFFAITCDWWMSSSSEKWQSLESSYDSSSCKWWWRSCINCLSFCTCIPGCIQCLAETGIIIAITVLLGMGGTACTAVSAPFVKMLIAYTVLYWFYTLLSAILFLIGAIIGSKWAFNIIYDKSASN